MVYYALLSGSSFLVCEWNSRLINQITITEQKIPEVMYIVHYSEFPTAKHFAIGFRGFILSYLLKRPCIKSYPISNKRKTVSNTFLWWLEVHIRYYNLTFDEEIPAHQLKEKKNIQSQ